jgi:archaemetzincin
MQPISPVVAVISLCAAIPLVAAADGTMQSLTRAADRIRPLHDEMAEPKPGEWLATHPEKGQTFQQYLKVRPRDLGTSRNTIYIAPVGRCTAEQAVVMRDTAEFLGIFYRMKVAWQKPIPEAVIPASARRVNRQTQQAQFDSIYIIRSVLPERVPSDAAALLALTATDLWPGNDWNFVFGQASLGAPTGVWSMNRLANSKRATGKDSLLYRTIKIATHETGHSFGIPHCKAYECGMNGASNLSETDRHPLAFCPACEAKVWLVGSANPVERYRQLADFARRHHFEAEERLWQASAEAVRK